MLLDSRWLTALTIVLMETKLDMVKGMCRQMMRVQNKGAQLASMNVTLENGTELTPREAHAIREFGLDSKLTVSGLGRAFGVTKSAASQLVSKLERRGFVVKSVSVRNGKERAIELTELGWEAFDAHARGYARNMADMEQRLGGFSLDQLAAASVILGVFEDVFEQRIEIVSK